MNDQTRYDLISLFLKYKYDKKDSNNDKDEENEELQIEDLKSLAMNFIIAGRDTTRMLLCWFLYILLYMMNMP